MRWASRPGCKEGAGSKKWCPGYSRHTCIYMYIYMPTHIHRHIVFSPEVLFLFVCSLLPCSKNRCKIALSSGTFLDDENVLCVPFSMVATGHISVK